MKVVLAVDGSRYGRWATEWVARMPFTIPPQVSALHVVDLVSLKAPLTPHPVVVWNEPFIRAEIKRREAQGKRVVAETKALLSSLDLKGKPLIEHGAVASTILNHATARGCLIVLGSRGLDAIDRFMLGSVSSKVTLHAPCSVLVVKQPPRPIRRLLLATDGSKSSEKAGRFLLHYLQAVRVRPNDVTADLDVVVLHVMPFLRYPEVKDTGKALVHHDAERLAKAGYQVEEVTKLGHPAEEIIRYAERQKIDLIVTGAKGLGAVARFFLGSVSTKLIQHSHCSVLVVR